MLFTEKRIKPFNKDTKTKQIQGRKPYELLKVIYPGSDRKIANKYMYLRTNLLLLNGIKMSISNFTKQKEIYIARALNTISWACMTRLHVWQKFTHFFSECECSSSLIHRKRRLKRHTCTAQDVLFLCFRKCLLMRKMRCK